MRKVFRICFASLLTMFSITILSGCSITTENTTNHNKPADVAPSLPQFELIESDKYKLLKQQLAEAEAEAEKVAAEIEMRKDELLIKHPEEYSLDLVKLVKLNLELQKREIERIKEELKQESEKLPIKRKNPVV